MNVRHDKSAQNPCTSQRCTRFGSFATFIATRRRGSRSEHERLHLLLRGLEVVQDSAQREDPAASHRITDIEAKVAYSQPILANRPDDAPTQAGLGLWRQCNPDTCHTLWLSCKVGGVNENPDRPLCLAHRSKSIKQPPIVSHNRSNPALGTKPTPLAHILMCSSSDGLAC